eukprot:gene32848-biopygen6891
MVLQNSGPIKLSDLAAQFGQTAAAEQNLKLSEYRRGGAYGVLAAVGANAAAPNVPYNNYNIKMSDFYGAYKIKTPVLNTIPTLTGTNTSANVTFSMASSYLVSSSNYGTVTWTMTGNPTGVTINSSTGVITATAGTSVNNSITVTATGPGAIPVSKTFTMTLTTTRLIIPSFPGVNNNAFVYAVIPGGPRTVLNYLQSFGVANTSTNNNDSLWSGGHDTLYYVGGQNNGTDFFSLYNRARVIQGDGQADGADWVVFNFTQDLNGDFDGKYQTSGYFGGGNSSSGGSMGTQELDGYIYGWGNNVWNILYKLPLGTRTSSFNHTNGNWFMSGGTVTSGYGKYSDFDSLNVTDIGFGGSSRFIASLSPVVDTAKTSIELLGGTLFATPTVGALAERLRKTTLITGVGQFNTEKLAVTFTKLYGMYFLNDVQQFTIEWTFTDGTNSFDSFFNKANTTNYGATYTFNVFNASGGLIFTSDSSVRKWCFSNSLNYATFADRVYVSQDDGIWGAAIQGNLDGNSPGPGLQINTGWGIQNYNSADTAYSGLFNNSVTITSGTVTKKFAKLYATDIYGTSATFNTLEGTAISSIVTSTSSNVAASSAAVKSAYDSAVSASNQTYGIGSLDSNGDILLRGNLRISETANLYKGTEVFSSGGGIITSDSNIVPSVNGTQDLGAPDKRWRNLYLSGNLISFGNGMNIDGYSWNYLANYVIPRRVYPKPLTNTESAYLFTGAAQDHSAYVRNGEMFVYGRNDYGQLGLGHTSNTITVPTKVPGINNAALVACGKGFTLCVRTDGTAISTGLNDNGQLGIGSTVTTSNFSIVAGVSNAIAVAACYTHSMYLTSNGVVVSAGSDANGQLGRGASSANVVINSNIVPMLMPDGSNVPARSISAGGYHSAVLLNNGSAYLCGKNDQGQCGASTTLVPQANSLGIIPSLSNVVDVACGHEHTLFTCYDGQVLGVGRNDRGQLGQGNKTSPVTSVVQVLAGGGAGSKNGLSVEIAAGFNHSAFIKNDSTIFVFGANDKGQLGLGETTTESLTPTQLVGYAGYDIACGRNHTVISTTPDPLVFNFTGNNALIAFGDNAYGQ